MLTHPRLDRLFRRLLGDPQAERDMHADPLDQHCG